jgi:hypothetical protein
MSCPQAYQLLRLRPSEDAFGRVSKSQLTNYRMLPIGLSFSPRFSAVKMGEMKSETV